MSIDVQQAIKHAMETEKNAMHFYQYGAQRFKDAAARKTFELLAGEEREHAGHFYRIYQGGDIPSLEAFLDTPFDNESGWLSAIVRKVAEDFNEQQAMEVAMEKEKRLEEALRDAAEKMTDPNVRAVYDLNVRETHNHYLLIESEYARIMGMVHESDMDTYVRE